MGILMSLAGFTKAMTFTVGFGGDDREVGVEVRPSRPDVPGPEYTRLWACYQAKMVYNLGYPKGLSAVLAVRSVSKVAEQAITSETDCFQRADFADVIRYSPNQLPKGGVRITGEMYAKGGLDRRIKTHLPLKGTKEQLVYSALAMLQHAVARNADEDDALYVLTATARAMVELYNTSVGVGMASIVQVPNLAYMKGLDALVGEGD